MKPRLVTLVSLLALARGVIACSGGGDTDSGHHPDGASDATRVDGATGLDASDAPRANDASEIATDDTASFDAPVETDASALDDSVTAPDVPAETDVAPASDAGCALAPIARPAWTGVTYQNPIIPMGATAGGVPNTHPPTEGCPDPTALRVDSATGPTYYIYCTSYTWPRSRTDGYPIYRSTDLAHWSRAGSLFPSRTAWPSWGARATDGTPYGLFWAPDVHRLASGTYVAYYALPCAGASTGAGPAGGQCVGVSHASSPTGPWTQGGSALVANSNNGVGSDGAYDPNLLIDDDGRLYLYWTVTAHGVFGREMNADGLTFKSAPPVQIAFHHPLNGGPADWDNGSDEGTFMVHHGAYYYLFYSAALYSSLDYFYSVGFMRAAHPLDTFVRYGPPILHRNDAIAGTGGNSVISDGRGHDFIVYHGVLPGSRCPNNGGTSRTNPESLTCGSTPLASNCQIQHSTGNPYCRVQGERQAMIDPLVWTPDPCGPPGAEIPRVPGDSPSSTPVHLP